MKFTAAILFVLVIGLSVFPQTPEASVAGFHLLQNEETAKTALQGYSPRYDNEQNLPKYFFYNEHGNQVMALTARSRERPFLIVGIEVFGVNETYQKKHYQLKNIASFTSESGFFLGARASAGSMIFGVANVTGAKDVIKKKGAPTADEKNGKRRFLRYKSSAAKQSEANDVKSGAYTAEYQFYKNKLKRFSIAVETAENKSNQKNLEKTF